MKKIAIMTALALAAVSASALEIGVRGTVSSADTSMADSIGMTIGQRYGKTVVEAGFDRTTRGAMNVNKWSAVGSYDLVSYKGVNMAAIGGAYFVDPSVGSDGAGVLVGATASYPLSKQVNLVAGYQYQYGASRVNFADGNYFTFGAKYSF